MPRYHFLKNQTNAVYVDVNPRFPLLAVLPRALRRCWTYLNISIPYIDEPTSYHENHITHETILADMSHIVGWLYVVRACR